MTTTPSTADRLRTLATDVFGWADLRPGQLPAMEAVAEGRDVVVVMPTGHGKSAIYQVAALDRPGPTVVVSPLISLQEDQIAGLAGAEDAGSTSIAVNSSRSAARLAQAWQQLADGTVEFVFLSPEQLANPDVVERLGAARPSLLVVDEAHCVSSWGHDFRPDYLRIADVVAALGRPPVVALTATAAPPVREEIVQRLGLDDPLQVVAGFDRPNISLDVRLFSDDAVRRQELREFVRTTPGPGVVYVSTRKDSERIAAELLADGIGCASYHAGMRAADRTGVHEAFLAGAVDVVVATSAFGMGIDKPDVRFVVHAAVSDSVDGYYQEIGRAGRDGSPSVAVLFHRSEDLALHRFHGSGKPDQDLLHKVLARVLSPRWEQEAGAKPNDLGRLAEGIGLSRRRVVRAVNLLEEAGVVRVQDGRVRPTDPEVPAAAGVQLAVDEHEARGRRQRSRLEMVRGYADTTGCRRRYLLGYFGEQLDADCGNCDTCRNQTERDAGDDRLVDVADGWRVDDRVTHPQWGAGVVMSLDGDRLTVLFEEEGYKTLDRQVAIDNDLLAAAQG